jgi:DNA-binding XRE family transcriptional regulator
MVWPGSTSIDSINNEWSLVQPRNTLSPLSKGIIFVAIGTAGLLTPQCISVGTGTSYVPIVNVRNLSPFRSVNSIAESAGHAISKIREVIGISITEIASTLNVSRQTIYGWINGGPISKKNSFHLSQLASVADVFEEANVAVTPYALRRRIDGGPSVLQTVATGGNALDMARALAETLQTEAQQQARMTKRLGNRPDRESLVTNSAPVSTEERA